MNFKEFRSLISAAECSITVDPNPHLSYKLPIIENSRWTYSLPSGLSNMKIEKEVTGYEEVSSGNSSYPSYKISWIYHLNDTLYNGIHVTDWVSRQGLIKSQIYYERVNFMPPDGTIQGNYQLTETILVNSINLK